MSWHVIITSRLFTINIFLRGSGSWKLEKTAEDEPSIITWESSFLYLSEVFIQFLKDREWFRSNFSFLKTLPYTCFSPVLKVQCTTITIGRPYNYLLRARDRTCGT